MKRTKRLMAPLALLLLSWLMPLDAFAANTTGDVNGDGEVNIADINAVIDVILGGATNPGADVNNDGEVNIAWVCPAAHCGQCATSVLRIPKTMAITSPGARQNRNRSMIG